MLYSDSDSEEEEEEEQEEEEEEEEEQEQEVEEEEEEEAKVAPVLPKKKKSFWASKPGVFIKGLPFTATVGEIENMLADCGELKGEIKQVLDDKSGRWTGSVIVMFKEAASVDLALSLDKTVWSGNGGDGVRYVSISKFDASAKKKAYKANDLAIFVGGLSATSTAEEVRLLFEPHAHQCGSIATVRLTMDKDKCRGFGHIEFDTPEGRAEALKLNGKLGEGVYVRAPTDPSTKKAQKKKATKKGKGKKEGWKKDGRKKTALPTPSPFLPPPAVAVSGQKRANGDKGGERKKKFKRE